MYCETCSTLVEAEDRCPQCGSRKLRVPLAGDYCYLTQKEVLWSSALEDLLRDNQIPCVTRGALGAGITSRIGSMLERVQFYVPYVCLSKARELEQQFFQADFSEETDL